MDGFFRTFYNDYLSISIYTLLLIIIGIYELRKNIKNNTFFYGTNLFILFYYVFIAVGPLYLIVFKGYQYNYNILFLFLFSLICFLVGANFVAEKSKFVIKGKNEVIAKKTIELNYKNVIRNSYIVLFISYIFASFYLFKNLSFIMQNVENNRVLAMQGSGIIVYFSFLMLPTTWILYYCNLHYEKVKCLKICIFIDILLLLLIGFRSRILELILFMIIIHNDYKPFNLKKLFKYAVLLIFLVTFLQSARTFLSTGSFSLNIDSFVTTMAVDSINLKYIFNYFPSKINYQYGYTFIISLLILLPNNSMETSLWLKKVLNMSFDGGGVNPSILGEFFINFGFIGMFVGMALLGYIIKRIDSSLIKNKNNSYKKIIYFIIFFYIARSISSGIGNYLILTTWFCCVVYSIFKFKIR